jgi:two-component system LytT family response regulator
MTKLRVLVVDDESSARARMTRLLSSEPDVEVAAVCEDLEEARKVLAGGGIDVALLDIQMPDGEGFELLEGLDRASRPAILFATAHSRYAVRAFDDEAVDYLLKPIDPERLREALARARTLLRERRATQALARLETLVRPLPAPTTGVATPIRLVSRQTGRIQLVQPAEIDWIEADRSSVRVHAGDQQHRVQLSMEEVETGLAAEGFVRIHRSAIVNLDRLHELKIDASGNYIVLLPQGVEQRVGRKYKNRFREILGARQWQGSAG